MRTLSLVQPTLSLSHLLLLLAPCLGFLPSTHWAQRGLLGSRTSTITSSAATATTVATQGGPGIPPELAAAGDVVPEGHRGLHDFLYGKGAEEAHAGASSSSSIDTTPLFSRDKAYSVPAWIEEFGSVGKIAAVYAVVDQRQVTRFVGVTRDVALSLKSHVQAKGPESVATVRIQGFRFPKRDEMVAFQDNWLTELDSVPEGNQEGGEGWTATIKEAAALSMSAEERVRYEDVKIKLRTAMADGALIDELEELENDTTGRRERLMKAVETTDWSPVIEAQTLKTVQKQQQPGGGEVATAPAATQEPAIVSPFSAPSGGAPASSSSSSSSSPPPPGPQGDDDFLELTPANVDKVLDEVRPYLISDGGNIEVVSVDANTRAVYLRLQGACGSCPSSTTTMKMGVERVLREKFKDLSTVEAVSPEPSMEGLGSEVQAGMLKGAVEAKLFEILPAIRGLGGVASVDSVSASGDVTLLFRGPDKVRLGLEYAIKSIKGVTSVSSKPPDS